MENRDSSRDRDNLPEGNSGNAAANTAENIDEKHCMLIKKNETLGHGFFEDEQLVNVVQNLVTSRYVALHGL